MKLLILLTLAAPTLACMGGGCCGGCFRPPPLCFPQLQLPRCCPCGGCGCAPARPPAAPPVAGGCGAYAAPKAGTPYAGGAGAPVRAVLVPVASGSYAGAPRSPGSYVGASGYPGGAPVAVIPAGGSYVVPAVSYVAPAYAG